jgi:hypothetical protein
MAGTEKRIFGPNGRSEKEDQQQRTMDRPSVPVTAIVLAAVGVMLLLMGSFFGLVAGLGIGGFLIPALVILVIGALMVATGYRVWKKAEAGREESLRNERERLVCDYCGGQNAEGELECQFCGAPLR